MNSTITNWLNRLLVRRGVLLVPVPPSTETLRSQAGRAEMHRHVRDEGRIEWADGADWMRLAAAACDEARFYRRAPLIKNWRCRCGKKLSEDGGGCVWHVNNRAQALAGEATEEQCKNGQSQEWREPA
jgi:hypothetical protein